MKKQPQPKAATKALETAVEAIVRPTRQQTEATEKLRAAKTPRLSLSLKAQANRLIAARDRKRVPTSRSAQTPKAKQAEPQDDLVVFAFRLSPEERDLIHKAAGPARASKFVRALAVAAACQDEPAIKLLMQSAKATA